MLDFIFNRENGGIIEKVYTDFIRVPLYVRRKIKYKDFDISIDEKGTPIITDSSSRAIDINSLDFNDNIEIFKNTNLLKALISLEENLLNKISDPEKVLNRLDSEVLLSFIEESKKIDNIHNREILVNYITEKLLCEQSENDISCRTIEIIRLLSRNDLENLQKVKSLLLQFPVNVNTLTSEIISYKEPMLPELQSDIELRKFCTIQYGFLKRLGTLGLISTNLVATTKSDNYFCIGNKCYRIENKKFPITMNNIYLSHEILEILSVVDTWEVDYKNYIKYIEQLYNINLVDAKYVMKNRG